MKVRKILKKSLLCGLGACILAFGIGFSIKADLGTSPISSFPYVTGQITGLTVGTVTIMMHGAFVLLQVLLLGKKFDPFQLTQMLVALLLGVMTDVSLRVLSGVAPQSYFQQWLLCLVGILLIGLSVSIAVTANFIITAGEGAVLAICTRVPVKFGNMKVIFDSTLVLISLVLSLVLLGRVAGIREGTVVAALLVGQVAKVFLRLLAPLRPWIEKE